jgi:hypothetical protein
MAGSASFDSAVLSTHAMSEMIRRGLPPEHVRRALAQPEQVVPVRSGRVVLHHRYRADKRDYLLRVLVDVDRDPPVVVTMYRTSKIEKYWETP